MNTPWSFGERLRRRFGAEADPGISLEKKGPDTDAAASLDSRIEKLATRTTPQRYTALGEIARGGMGVILKVWDDDLQRALAMKVMLANGKDATAAGDPQTLEKLHRFLAEAQITSQMDHHGIPPVHEIGIDSNGHVYFTMALIKGQDLGEIIDLARQKKDGWNLTRALAVIVKVCETVAYAHSKGVIHRDLKPSNILIGRFGQVYVMDWGVAKVLGSRDARDLRLRTAADEPPSDRPSEGKPPEKREEPVALPDTPLMTMDGSVLGTPSYMPPEQANGNIDDLGPHSDVYSVGAMLYTLLTGHMPYVKPGSRNSPRAILLAVRNGPSPPIADTDPQAPAELVAICNKAMARRPDERYADMNDMAEDVRAYLENRVVSVYWTGTVAECAKWLARNKPLAIGTLAFLALAIAAWIDIGIIQSRTGAELSKAGLEIVKAHDEALVSAEQARHKTYAAYIAAADACLRADDVREARRHLDACSEGLRGWEWRHLLLKANDGRATIRWRWPEGEVRSVSFSPDSRFLAAASQSGAVHVWDRAAAGAPRKLGKHEAAANAVTFSPGAGWIVSGADDGSVRLWSAGEEGAPADFRGHGGPVTGVAFVRGDERLASGSRDGTINLWEAPSGRLLSTLHEHHAAITVVVTSPEAGRIASAAADDSVILWEGEGGETLQKLPAQGRGVLALAITGSGNVVAAADTSGTVWIWNGVTGEPLGALAESAGEITALSFSPGGERLVAGQADGNVRLWDCETGDVVFGMAEHDERIRSVAFSPDGNTIASASVDGTVLLWEAGPARIAETKHGN